MIVPGMTYVERVNTMRPHCWHRQSPGSERPSSRTRFLSVDQQAAVTAGGVTWRRCFGAAPPAEQAEAEPSVEGRCCGVEHRVAVCEPAESVVDVDHELVLSASVERGFAVARRCAYAVDL
jgi:hypothetical protein